MKLSNMKRYNDYFNSGLYDIRQMSEIFLGLKDDIDVTIYADPAISAEEMEEKRLALLRDKNNR